MRAGTLRFPAAEPLTIHESDHLPIVPLYHPTKLLLRMLSGPSVRLGAEPCSEHSRALKDRILSIIGRTPHVGANTGTCERVSRVRSARLVYKSQLWVRTTLSAYCSLSPSPKMIANLRRGVSLLLGQMSETCRNILTQKAQYESSTARLLKRLRLPQNLERG